MVRELLKYNPSLGWAIHGSERGWYAKSGSCREVAELLLNAGAKPPENSTKDSEAVRAVLRKS